MNEYSKAHATMMPPLSDFYRSIKPAHQNQNKMQYVLGIIEEFDNNHLPYIAACKEWESATKRSISLVLIGFRS